MAVSLPLSDVIAALAANPRAVPWVARCRAGLGATADERPIVCVAPPVGRAVRPVFQRVHNAILLTQPATVRLDFPPGLPHMAEEIEALSQLHHIPIALGAEPLPVGAVRHVPTVEEAPRRPAGPGIAVGLDIGGTGMKACAVDASGRILRLASAATWPEGEEGIDSLVRRCRALILDVAAGAPVGSLGIGLASPMGARSQVLELSTVMRARLGDPHALDNLAPAISRGIVDGPVSMFNDLINLGRQLSDAGERRLVRLQIGTSFGGCWIDAGGEVVATEMARLVVDASPGARRHPYLPISGVARAYLSNVGVADDLAVQTGMAVEPAQAGLRLRALLDARDPAGEEVITGLATGVLAAIDELSAILVGIQTVEIGGSMLQGPAAAALTARVRSRCKLAFRVAERPGHDGAVAAALAPRVAAPLRSMRRVV